jgi:alcohol dehydrogenase (NADP+)
MQFDVILQLLRPGGHLCLVGAPESDSLKIHPFTLLMCEYPYPDTYPAMTCLTVFIANAHVSGSAIGSPATIKEMLQFAVDNKVHPWIKKYPLKEANKAIVSQYAGEARYRYVLVNEDNGGKL